MTPIAAVAASAPEIVRLELCHLITSVFNPRKTLDPSALKELTESIRQHGLRVPLLVRPLRSVEVEFEDGTFESTPFQARNKSSDLLLRPGIVSSDVDDSCYEIIAGSRRYAALSAIDPTGWADCIVREMTDDEAREIALIDNLQREDMPALEEADAYEALRQQLGDAERIAARVGKPIEYVTKRLKLVALGELQREALAHRLITVDHALLLARLGVEEQDKNLKWALDVNAGIKTTVATVVAESVKRRDQQADSRYVAWEPQSVPKLKNHIEQHAGRALSKAPWSLDDADLVKAAGACSGCPSNTAHNTALFADLAIEEATCEDGACFESKRAAFVQIKLHDACQDQAAVQLSYTISEAAPRMAKDGSGPNVHSVLRYGQWLDVKKGSCPYVRNGVTVDWEGDRSRSGNGKPGITKLVCIAVGCKVHPKSYEKKADNSGLRNNNGAAAAAEREKKKPLLIEENKRRIAFIGKALEQITTIPASVLRFLVIERLPDPNWADEDDLKALNALLPGIRTIASSGKIDSPAFAQAATLASLPEGSLQVDIGGWRNPTDQRPELIKAVRAFGYTGPDPWSEAKDKPKAAKPAVKKAAAKKAVPAKKVAPKKAAKKAVKKGGRK